MSFERFICNDSQIGQCKRDGKILKLADWVTYHLNHLLTDFTDHSRNLLKRSRLLTLDFFFFLIIHMSSGAHCYISAWLHAFSIKRIQSIHQYIRICEPTHTHGNLTTVPEPKMIYLHALKAEESTIANRSRYMYLD